MKTNSLIFTIFFCIISVTTFAQTSYRFEGFIEMSQKKKLPITVKLTVQGTQFSGSYYYNTIGNNIKIAGVITQQFDKKFEIKETNEKGSITGYFIGNWNPNESILHGKWLSSDRKRSSNFAWRKVPLIPYDLVVKSDEKQQESADNKATKSYTIPQMKDYADAAIQDKFNQYMDAQKPEMSIEAAEIKDNVYLSKSISVICATEEFISYHVIGNQAGETNGAKELHSFETFDLKKGVKINLEDVLKQGLDKEKWFAPYKEKWVKDTHIDNADKGTWHLVLTEDNLQFVFTDIGNAMNYDEITYTPIVILHKDLQNVINPDSALGRWLAKK